MKIFYIKKGDEHKVRKHVFYNQEYDIIINYGDSSVHDGEEYYNFSVYPAVRREAEAKEAFKQFELKYRTGTGRWDPWLKGAGLCWDVLETLEMLREDLKKALGRVKEYGEIPDKAKLIKERDEVWKLVCDNPGHTAWELRNILGKNVGVFLKPLLRTGKIYRIKWQNRGIRYYPKLNNA